MPVRQFGKESLFAVLRAVISCLVGGRPADEVVMGAEMFESALRARDLKLEHVHQGIQDKRACFEAVVKQEGLQLDEAAFVGDDVIDLPAMRAGGLAIAVQNARAEVKQDAHYITPHAGGGGALRDAVELILNAQGKWERVVEEYIGEKVAKGSSQRSAVSHQRRSKSR